MKYAQLLTAIDSTSQDLLGRAATAVNQALVIRNWLIGAYIVEFEQHGEDRAKYGARLLETLANDLGTRAVRGCSADMLERMRQLYQEYPQLKSCISAPAVRKFFSKSILPGGPEISAPPVRKSRRSPPILPAATLLRFSWTHLIEFLNIRDPWRRAFYENECLKGNWSKRQLQRQIGSLLFERTGLSKDKSAVVRRAHRQESPANAADLLRDPYVLEFTGLAEDPTCILCGNPNQLAVVRLQTSLKGFVQPAREIPGEHALLHELLVERCNYPLVLRGSEVLGDEQRQDSVEHRVLRAVDRVAMKARSQERLGRPDRFLGLFEPVGDEGPHMLSAHAATPSRRMAWTRGLSDSAPRSKASSSNFIVATRTSY